MISIDFSVGNYIVRDDDGVISYTNNIHKAMDIAYNQSSGEPFLVSCPVPKYEENVITPYCCPKCGSNVRLFGSLNTADFEPSTKDDTVYCAYCDQKYIVSWLVLGF